MHTPYINAVNALQSARESGVLSKPLVATRNDARDALLALGRELYAFVTLVLACCALVRPYVSAAAERARPANTLGAQVFYHVGTDSPTCARSWPRASTDRCSFVPQATGRRL